MKKFFAIILGAIGLNALFAKDVQSSLPPEISLGEKEPITELNFSNVLPTFKDAKSAAAGILNQIGQYEARGNYNVIYGGSTVPLTDMTLNEVRAYQEVMLKEQAKRGVPAKNRSSAVGKYQFIRKTFDDTRQKLGLSGNTKFTPAIQDEFAYYQLKQAGWEDYIAENISLENMMLRISRIWASFPKDFTGVSYYAGVANNKALVSPEKVASTLQDARKA